MHSKLSFKKNPALGNILGGKVLITWNMIPFIAAASPWFSICKNFPLNEQLRNECWIFPGLRMLLQRGRNLIEQDTSKDRLITFHSFQNRSDL